VARNTFSPNDCRDCHHWRFLIFGSRSPIYSGESESYHWRLLVLDGRSPISSDEFGNKNPWPPGDASTFRYPFPANHCSLPYPSPATNGSTIYAVWGGKMARPNATASQADPPS